MAESHNTADHTIGQYAKAVLDSLSAHIAILNSQGAILETNHAWRVFAQSNQVQMRPDMIGVNYLDICDTARGAECAGEVADGIRAVIRGDIKEFVIDYPCHSDNEQRWFYMRATRLAGSNPLRVVVSHENITTLKEIEHDLKQREHELQSKTHDLEESNITLKVLLEQREHDKRELEEQFRADIAQLVAPYIDQLKHTFLNTRQKTYLDILDVRLHDILSPFSQKLYSLHRVLTPQEIQVVALIKDGKTSKAISDVLNLSLHTVHFHRKNIRKKLGLNNQQANLRTYLLSLEK